MSEQATRNVPVPTVRVIAPDADGRVLLLQRSRGTEQGDSWCLPGGKVDYGETVEATVSKELREETSLVCLRSRFLFYQDSLPTVPGGMHCINLYFECQVEGSVRLNDESSNWIRIGPDDLGRLDIVFGNAEGLRRYWGKER